MSKNVNLCHMANMAAGFSEDGELLSANGSSVAGEPALAKIWSGVSGRVERTIQYVDFPGTDIAIVHVATEYTDTVRRNEIFVTVKEHLKWNIWVQQTLN